MLPKEMTGKKFGKWTVICKADPPKDIKNRSGFIFWKCLCECGKESIVNGASLRSGKTRACGCGKNGNAFVTHGNKRNRKPTPTYIVWQNMMARCYNPSNPAYNRYGGRGITVCEEWHKFENFLSDMGEKPDKLTIDRINNNSIYTKSNCRWATRTEQCENRHPKYTFKENPNVRSY